MMAAMHVYLPTTLTELERMLHAGAVGPAPLDGFTLTSGLRTAHGGSDDEELEYLAQLDAAAASLLRLDGDPFAVRRRTVLVVDVDVDSVRDEDGLAVGTVVLDDEVPLARLVSALVDDVQVVPVVQGALAAPDDRDAREELDEHQLLWFAAQELRGLVAGTAD